MTIGGAGAVSNIFMCLKSVLCCCLYTNVIYSALDT